MRSPASDTVHACIPATGTCTSGKTDAHCTGSKRPCHPVRASCIDSALRPCSAGASSSVPLPCSEDPHNASIHRAFDCHRASLATRAATHCMHACVPALPRLHRTTSTSFADPLRLGPLRGTRFLTWPALAGLACIQQMRLPASVRQRGPCSHFVNELLGAVWLSGIATFNTLCR
jgi:hypothetical protein